MLRTFPNSPALLIAFRSADDTNVAFGTITYVAPDVPLHFPGPRQVWGLPCSVLRALASQLLKLAVPILADDEQACGRNLNFTGKPLLCPALRA